jgi:O-antigen/teichoic acid export membrane protein
MERQRDEQFQPAEDGRDESSLERLDRNTTELLNELRVAGTGIQVMLAFLLVVPFNAGWRRVNSFDRYAYYVTLLCMALAAVLLIAPSIYHRILFRRAQKAYIVAVGNRLAILAMAFMTVGLTGVIVLISDVVFGAAVAVIAGVLTAITVSVLWFVIPLGRRSNI